MSATEPESTSDKRPGLSDHGGTASAAAGSGRRLALIGTIGLLATGTGAWFAWQRLAPAPAADGAVALLRELSLPDAQGNPYRLADLGGRTVVLNFWATWCPPCLEEMPELAMLHREIEPRRGLVVGIGIDSPGNIREFAAKHSLPYPLLVAGMGGTELSRQFGNQAGALPFTVILSPAGQIVHRTLGRIRLQQLRDAVQPHLA